MMRSFLALGALLTLLLPSEAVTRPATRTDDDGWVITARNPTGDYHAAAVANGELGVTVGRELFSLGQLLLGDASESGTAASVSRILEGINPLGLSLRIDGRPVDNAAQRPEWQQIDLRRGVHASLYRIDRLTIETRVRALRNMPYALMTEVHIEADRDAELLVANRASIPAIFTDTLREMRTVSCEDRSRMYIQRTSGRYDGGEERIVASSTFLGDGACEALPSGELRIVLRKGETARFALVGSICTTESFDDPWNESERQVIYAVREGIDHLIEAHERLWERLWQSDIEIEGDREAQLQTRFALYSLYGSIREGSRRSIPPMGLTMPGYNGHIFWDSEIWMFPALLVLRPELARQMLDFRFDGLDAARRRASVHGYRGAMYPWEADPRGEESTPTSALTGPLEHHISADIAIACWNYYCVTHDRAWLLSEGYPILREMAAFWCDRVMRNDDGSYSIRNVIGANEYAVGVTDNAFTNGSARRALEYAAEAAELCGERPDPQWREIAAGLRILRFADGTTREHAAYDGEQIKQADANLLGYPLGIVTDRESLLRDLAYYAERIDPQNGPAMSYSVFAVQYARLGMAREAEAMFRRAYRPNLRPPFGTFAETATSGNPYFMTGAGGMLQAVLFGFGGLEITPEGLVQRASVLPASWKSLTIRANGALFRVER